jgi:hypothetical protein
MNKLLIFTLLFSSLSFHTESHAKPSKKPTVAKPQKLNPKKSPQKNSPKITATIKPKPEEKPVAKVPIKPLQFESCETNKNEYFEPFINFENQKLTRDKNSENCTVENPIITKNSEELINIKKIDLHNKISACILASMLNAPKPYPGICYAKCNLQKNGALSLEQGTEGEISCIEKPCVTQNTHKKVAEAFNAVSDCLKLDSFDFFQNLNLESGFQMNIRSYTGVWGIGQLEDRSFEEIKRRKTATKFLEKNECQSLRNHFERFDSLTSESLSDCEKIWPPTQPTFGLLSAGLLFLSYRQSAEASFKEIFEKKLNKKQILKDEEPLFITEIARVMYNGGPAATETILEEVNRSFKKQTDTITFHEFKKNFKSLLKAYYSPYPKKKKLTKEQKDALKEKRKEISMYTSRILERTQNEIEQRYGIECSENN